MKNQVEIKIMAVLAAIAVTAGTLMLAVCFANAGKYREELQTAAARLEALRIMQEEMAVYASARKKCEDLPEKTPVPIRSLLEKHFDGKPQDIRSSVERPVRGWTVKKYDIVFADVAVSNAMQLCRDAERGSPPWKMTACSINVSGHKGRGTIALSFEALQAE